MGNQITENERVAMLRLAANRNTLQTTAFIGNLVLEAQKKNEVAPHIWMNVLFWELSVGIEGAKLIEENKTFLMNLIGKNAHLDLCWNKFLCAYENENNNNLGLVLRKIRDKVSFHFDKHPFKDLITRSVDSDSFKAQTVQELFSKMATECVQLWLFEKECGFPRQDIQKYVQPLFLEAQEFITNLTNLIYLFIGEFDNYASRVNETK